MQVSERQAVRTMNSQTITVATYPTYRKAELGVRHLLENKFPVQYVSIIAEGLETIEKVTGRMTAVSSMAIGFFAGAVIGSSSGLFFGLLSLMQPIVSSILLAGYGLLYGSISGVMIGLFTYVFLRDPGDFSSQFGFRARFYDLVVHEQYADQATELLKKYHDQEAKGSQQLNVSKPHQASRQYLLQG